MKKNDFFLIFFIVSFIVIVCFCFSKEEVVVPYNSSEIVTPDTPPEVIETDPNLEIRDINELRKSYSNNDIVGVIKIESIGLETIVVQGSDNSYYLKHDINKNSSIFGTEFVDSRNSTNLTEDKQINVYGHNSRNKDYYDNLEFTKLNKITDKETFEKLSNIYFYVDGAVLEYKPYVVKVITTDNEYTRLIYRSPEILKKHLENLTSNTMYCKDECNIPEDKKIIILQTCYYEPDDSYLLLIGIN